MSRAGTSRKAERWKNARMRTDQKRPLMVDPGSLFTDMHFGNSERRERAMSRIDSALDELHALGVRGLIVHPTTVTIVWLPSPAVRMQTLVATLAGAPFEAIQALVDPDFQKIRAFVESLLETQ